MKTLSSFLLAAVLLLPVGAMALEMEKVVLYPVVEYISWEEEDQRFKIADEDGAVYGLGIAANVDLYQRTFYLNVKGELLGGDLDRDGLVGDPPVPIEETETSFFAINTEADLGYRLPLQNMIFEPFAGLGYRWWNRRIKNTFTIDPEPPINAGEDPFFAPGFAEAWETFLTKVGLRFGWQSVPPTKDDKGISVFAEAGGMFPFWVRNDTDFTGFGWTKTKPDGKWSFFGEAGIQYQRLQLSAFYEGFRFDPSDPVIAVTDFGFEPVAQPKTNVDIYGIRLGFVF